MPLPPHRAADELADGFYPVAYQHRAVDIACRRGAQHQAEIGYVLFPSESLERDPFNEMLPGFGIGREPPHSFRVFDRPRRY